MQYIVFVHKGYSYYLELAVAQAKYYNPECEVILFGDNSNKRIKNVTHYEISEYSKKAKEFDACFFNVSPNRRSYELFCFQRWFIIKEFIEKNPEYDDDFVYCDSDTLLYDKVIPDLKDLSPNILATEAWESPGFTFFKKGTLSDFCDMILWLYTTKEGLDVIKYYANKFDREQLGQGISDMTAFLYYTTVRHQNECVDAQQPTSSWTGDCGGEKFCYDHNINIADGFKTDIWGRKAISFVNGIPYAVIQRTHDKVRFKGLHFQGDAKYMMIRCQNKTPKTLRLLAEYTKGYVMYRVKVIIRYVLGKLGLSLRKI